LNKSKKLAMIVQLHRMLLTRSLVIALLFLGFVKAQGQTPAPIPQGMVKVRGGRYKPLNQSGKEPVEVVVKSFYLDQFPVTNGEFLEFLRANPAWQRSHVRREFADEGYLINWAGDLEPGSRAGSNSPVVRVSWFAASAYCAWKEKRLPSAAEWEYVAAASATRPDGENDAEHVKRVRQWYSTPAPEILGEVGQRPANYFGVYDMHGLIWEWVADFDKVASNSGGKGNERVCGSGSLGAKDSSDYPAFLRYGLRSSLKANYTVHNLGFRCARNLDEAR
jgi:sulfatase modifying factor 1